MWCRTSQQVQVFVAALITTWRVKTASRGVSGLQEAWSEQRDKWPHKQHFLGSSGRIATRQSGRAASVCHPRTDGKVLSNGLRLFNLFLKKWTLTRPNMGGRRTATRTKTITFTFGFAVSAQAAHFGTKSTPPGAPSQHARPWRPSLTSTGTTVHLHQSPALPGRKLK